MRDYANNCSNDIIQTKSDDGKGIVRNIQYARDSYKPSNSRQFKTHPIKLLQVVYLWIGSTLGEIVDMLLLPKEARPSKRHIFTQSEATINLPELIYYQWTN